MSNHPKILVEFDPEEVKWLADLFHVEWSRTIIRHANAKSDDHRKKLDEHQDMQNKLRNRILDKANEQGFGDL